MQKRSLQQQMYELSDPSLTQRITLAALIGACVAVAWWLLFAGGIAIAGSWFGWVWTAGDPFRRATLAVALSIYFIRVLFTEFVFLRRGVSWAEVLTIAPWVFCIFVLLSISGGTNFKPAGSICAAGITLFVLGSWMNSYAELKRHIWKLKPENQGKLYTLGLFRYSRHPNYLGDLLSFTGLCLISGRSATAVVPVLMLAGFVFANIPVLDAHLYDRYGQAFEQYAARTKKLIPFLY